MRADTRQDRYAGNLASSLRADVALLAECALRLRDVASTLRGTPHVPDWVEATLRRHVTRCCVAADDVENAVRRLDEATR